MRSLSLCLLTLAATCATAQPLTEHTGGNPVVRGWYADPEAIVYGDTCWLFPTFSAPYDEQTHFDAFASRDLRTWTKYPRVLTSDSVRWARRAMWAPSVVQKNGQYYLFFSANDVHEGEVGGIGVAVASKPEGPYRDALGHPLINDIVHGAQPIDQYIFCDDDGENYLYYGGWGHCNVVRLSPDLLRVVPFPDGETYKEITPKGYVEGPFMLKLDGKYYFMWSEGGWTGPDYHVAYAIATSPFGPFERIGTILQQDERIARGAGHHSLVRGRGKKEFYIVYHRRPLTETDGNHRETCIDRLRLSRDGHIRPVRMTRRGVRCRHLRPLYP